MNFDTESALNAQQQWELDRRDEENPKLVITPAWELRLVPKPPDPFPYTGRWAKCPRCGAGPPSALLLELYPDMIEERPGEESDLYRHQCEEES